MGQEGGAGAGEDGLNAPTKRSSGHKKLNPFFMTEAEFERTEGAGAGADRSSNTSPGFGKAVAKRECKKLSSKLFAALFAIN